MIALRPWDQHVWDGWDPRPVPHETEAETKTNYCETETETETKKWSWDHAGLETLTSLGLVRSQFHGLLGCLRTRQGQGQGSKLHVQPFCFRNWSSDAGALVVRSSNVELSRSQEMTCTRFTRRCHSKHVFKTAFLEHTQKIRSERQQCVSVRMDLSSALFFSRIRICSTAQQSRPLSRM